MLKYFTIISYFLIALFVCSCATGPSSMEFTSAKTKARSEKNLAGAENFALEAMKLEVHQNDARVPYFIATEIYLKQKKWVEMSEMLDEAMRRNPEQELEEPKLLIDPEELTKDNVKESFAYTIQDAVIFYRKNLWVDIYNESIAQYNNENYDKAIESLQLTIHLDSNNVNSYIMLSTVYRSNEQIIQAENSIDKGLKLNDITPVQTAELYSIRGEILKQVEDYPESVSSYKQAYDYYGQVDDKNKAMSMLVAILSLNLKISEESLLLEDWLESIQWAEKVYEDFYLVNEDNAINVLMNIALAYNNLASSYYNLAGNVIKLDNASRSNFQESMNNYNIAFEYFDLARDFFLELEDMGSEDGESMARQVKDYLDLIEDTQVPYIQKQINSLNSN